MRKLRGFTLVELLVVITIIVVLAGIIFPVAMRMAGKGNETKCMMQIRELGTGLGIYKSEKKKYPAYSGRQFVAALYRSGVVNESKLFICPSSDEALDDDWADIAEEALKGKAKDPVENGGTSYAGRRNNPKHKTTIRSASRRNVPASRVPVFADGIWEGEEGPETSHGDRIFIGFLDGHVEMFKVADDLNDELRMGEGAEHKYLRVLSSD